MSTVLAQELTVRQTEELVRKLSGEKPASAPKRGPSPDTCWRSKNASAAAWAPKSA
jgi:hypothetical protein